MCVFMTSFLFVFCCQVHELLGLWREEFPRGMPPEEYARKRNQLSTIRGAAAARHAAVHEQVVPEYVGTLILAVHVVGCQKLGFGPILEAK